jgi:rhodanese-related sulfurtransferase
VTVPEIDVADLQPLHEAGATVIDVREPDEYEEGHVPGAQLIPLQEVPDRLGELPTSGEIYVICKSGARSRRAAEFLAGHGFSAHNVAGGTMAWIDAGLPVDQGAAS